jgi:transglutaminase-like putative cysteine protease
VAVRWSLCVLAWLAPALLPLGHASAEPTIHARLDRLSRSYDLHADLTWVELISADKQVFTQRGLRDHERSSYTFYPKTQSLELVEAWVEQPDGTRLPVGDNARFTRPSEQAQSAPGFTSAMTTTILYPQLREGSRTHVLWKLTQKSPGLLGFNVEAIPPLDMPVGEATVSITAPAEVALHWSARGAFAVTEQTESGQHVITARIAATSAEEPERNMVDASDFAPLFLATSLPDLQELGAIYYRQSQPKAAVTPAIAALAARVAGTDSGLAAARDVYDWVAANIRYVAVYMDPNDGWVPHAAADVLRDGYGDCKDHVVLMQAMLAALGIRAEAALIEQGNRTRDLPLWVPQFNHAIVYLPEFDRFANPTNPYARFDSLDRLLAGRTVVLASEHGDVVHTPPARPQDNTYVTDSHVAIAEDGSIDGSVTILPAANLESAARAATAQAVSTRDVAERLLAATPEGGFGAFSTTDPRDLTRPFQMTGNWHSSHGVTFDSREAFMTVPVGLDLDPPSHLRGLLSDSGTRRHALLTAVRDFQWSTTLTMPPGVAATRLPHDVSFANAAGSYTAAYEHTGAALRVVRHLVVDRTVFEAADYNDLEALVYAALDDSRAVLVLARAEASAPQPSTP